jgi:ABC-2 type transport system permease protein
MRWRKIGVVAATEFQNSVRSKMFLIGVIILPLLVGGSIYLQQVLARRIDTTPRVFAVIDRTGVLYPALAQAAERHNRVMRDEAGNAFEPPFHARRADVPEPPGPDDRLALADRVRAGELSAFVEIPADAIDPRGGRPEIRYYSGNPNDSTLSRWLETTISAEIRNRRLLAAGIDPAEAARLSTPVEVESLTLPERVIARPGASEGGGIREARKVDKVRSVAVPATLMFIVYMVVMMMAQPLSLSVIEEKTGRISEVLLGSLTPFEMMMGKLLGGAAVALLLAALYVGGGYVLASRYGYADSIPAHLLAATVLFIVMALFMYGSLYLALGSACSELKDAQSLMMPVAIVAMMPILLWVVVLRSPDGPLSVILSLIPLATPFLMLLRMGLMAVPAWQVGLSIVLTAAAVVACVWAAGKIFRTGLLMQGKPPSFAELARWVVAR